MITYRKIIQGKFKFPKYFTPSAKDIISKLLKSKPTKRFGVLKGGANLIRAHEWFMMSHFDWKALKQQEMKAPYVPNIKSTDDMSNFDKFKPETNEDLAYKGDPCLGWDADF